MLLVPAGGEQPLVAEACRSAGVAHVVPPDEADPERIASESQSLVNNSPVRARAQQMRTAFSRVDSFSITTDLLEALVVRHAPVAASAGMRSSIT